MIVFLKTTFPFFKRYFWFMALPYFLLYGFDGVLQIGIAKHWFSSEVKAEISVAVLSIGLSLLFSFLFYWNLFLSGMAVFGKYEGISSVWSQIKARFGLSARIWFYVFIKIYAGFLMLIIPGLIWMVRYTFATLSAVVEDKAINVLEVSESIVRARFWRLSWIYSLFFLFGIFIGLISLGLYFSFGQLGMVVANIVFMPFLYGFGLFFHAVVYKHYRDEILPQINPSDLAIPNPSWTDVLKWFGLLMVLLGCWVAFLILVF